jgi:hypothetical protein
MDAVAGPDHTPDELADTVDHLALNRLLARYADTVTRRAWGELPELFLPDATVHLDTVTRPALVLSGPEELGRFIGDAVERFSFFEFVVLNQLVDLRTDGDPDVASARVFMCEQRCHAADGAWSTAYGVYLDRYRRVDRRWWFAGRRYRSLARRGADGSVLPWPSELAPDAPGADEREGP